MKKSAYSEQREMIVAEAINPIATELRLLDPADLISLLNSSAMAASPTSSLPPRSFIIIPARSISVRVANTSLNGKAPEIVLDLEIKPKGATVYAQLILANEHAAVEINHVSFQNPSENPDENTEFLRRSLMAAQFVPAHQGEAA